MVGYDGALPCSQAGLANHRGREARNDDREFTSARTSSASTRWPASPHRRATSSTRSSTARRSGSAPCSSPSGTTRRRRRPSRGAAGAVSERITHLHRRHQPQHPPPDGHRGLRPHDAEPHRRPLRARARARASRCCRTPTASPASRPRRWRTSPASCAGCSAARSSSATTARPARGRSCTSTPPSTSTSRWASSRSGPNTLELAGRCFDEVVLHTFFTDETTARCVRDRQAGRRAGRAATRTSVKVWSCFATVGDHIPEDKRLMKLVGRLGHLPAGLRRPARAHQRLGSRRARALPRRPGRRERPRASTSSAPPSSSSTSPRSSPTSGSRRRPPARPSSASRPSATSSTSAATASSCTAPRPPSSRRSSTSTA